MNDTDGFQALCKRDPVNTKARLACSYTLWPDQSLATRLAPLAPGAQIFILHPTAEAGMPHTRGPNHICLPAYFPESRTTETIQHELVHLDQRARPQVWRERLQREGWTPVEDDVIPLEWRRRCRLNPDTASARFWMWQGRWIPMPVFQREDIPHLRDVDTWWYDRKEEHASRTAPKSFTARYGTLHSFEAEHPYELYAYNRTTQ